MLTKKKIVITTITKIEKYKYPKKDKEIRKGGQNTIKKKL